VRESSESTKETEAKKLLRLREGDVAKGVSVTPRMTIDELPTDLETEYRVNGRDTLKDLEGRLRLHIRPYFGGRRAAAITTADIRDFISKRQNTGGASNGEIDRELAAIKRAFNLAIQGGKLIHAPYNLVHVLIPILKPSLVPGAHNLHDCGHEVLGVGEAIGNLEKVFSLVHFLPAKPGAEELNANGGLLRNPEQERTLAGARRN